MSSEQVKSNLPLKSICIPAAPPVNVSDYVPLIDHPLFQRLRLRKQLGVNYLVFPGAVHTRFEHAIGSLALTQRLCHIQRIPADDARCLCAFALLHDIGHGPFSHQIEPIIGDSHKDHGLECLEAFTTELDECGIDRDRLAAYFRGEDPLAQFVSDRNLGTDKLDYLTRDALHIGFTGMPDVEKIQYYTAILEEGGLAIEEKFLEDIKRVQKFYSYLHQHGYLNKTALSVQRIFQRAVQEELAESHVERTDLWDMTDEGLSQWLRTGKSSLARSLIALLDTRAFHRSAFVIKPNGFGYVERRAGKDVQTCEWSRQKIRRFSETFSCCDRLTALENALAEELEMPPGDVLFAAMPFFDKLVPRDVRVFSARTGRGFWLFTKDRDHCQSLQGDYSRTFAIRVIVPPDKRAAVRRQSDTIQRFLEQSVKNVS